VTVPDEIVAVAAWVARLVMVTVAVVVVIGIVATVTVLYAVN
jgi:hypothetical protein